MWAVEPGATVVPGDFNADGKTDLALTGPGKWASLPVATSKGDGSFTVTNTPSAAFASWSPTFGVRVLPGDFNGDGRTDIA